MVAAPKTVLIADDDRLILAELQYALSQRGYNVLIAENGTTAIGHLEQVRIDIVFLDVLMPEKDGLETLLEIKRRFPSVPVYVMSGGGTRSKQDFLTIAQKFGATGTIQKPATAANFIKIVEGLSRSAIEDAKKTA